MNKVASHYPNKRYIEDLGHSNRSGRDHGLDYELLWPCEDDRTRE